jgi:uncharacterized membrane protein
VDKKKELVRAVNRYNVGIMYLIIGGDKMTYGPVTADEVHRWIREGRADERTQIKREGGTNWEDLGNLSEFFPPHSSSPPKILREVHPSIVSATGTLRVGDCVRQGWQVYRQDPWRITGIIALVFVAQFLLNSIPLAGALLAFLLNGPILGGIYNFCHQVIHGHTRGLPDVMDIVKTRFLPCFLATTVSSLLAFGPFLLSLIPAAALFGASGVVMEEITKHPNLILGMGLPLLAGFFGMMYFLICWSFAVPIAACSETDFWESLKLSWHGVRKNFWSYVGLLILLGGINLIGILCLGLGLFITIPITFLATMSAYDQIFRATDSR